MRHRTEDHLPGRCKNCWLRQELCICAHIPRVSSPVSFVVVRHALEARKSTNTVRVAELAIAPCQVLEYDGPDEALDRQLASLKNPYLLFPDGQTPSKCPPMENLVVLDGTWKQARKMTRKLPSLMRIPRLSLPPPPEAVTRLRHSDDENHMSTLEAMAQAMAYFGQTDDAQKLHALHALWVRHTLIGRGKLSRNSP